MVELIMILPGKVAGHVRRQASTILVRYMGGDMSLVGEIAQKHVEQNLDEEDPRLFGLESDAIKRKREEVTLAELDLQLCEHIVALKRRKIKSYQFCMSALTDLSADDPRSELRCADMIRYVAWGSDTQDAGGTLGLHGL